LLDIENGSMKNFNERIPAVERLLYLARSIRFLNEKWNVDLLLILEANGPLRYNILRDVCKATFGNGISSRTLILRLSQLQKRNLVERCSYAESPPRVEYSLTKDGKEFAHTLKQAITILNRHMARVSWDTIDPAMRKTIERGRKNLEKRMNDTLHQEYLLRLYHSLPPIESKSSSATGTRR